MNYPVIAVLQITKDLIKVKLPEINKARAEKLMPPLNMMELTHLAIKELTAKQATK